MNADDLLLDANGEAPRFCLCSELVIDGRRIPCPKYHNCEYVRQRNDLLPQAMARATELAFKSADDSTTANIRFTRTLSIEMDKLAAPLLKNGRSPGVA